MGKSTAIDKVPFILVTGFLGSGKTSVLKHLLSELGDQKRIAIVQNEFAPGNSDSKELKDLNKPFELMEVNKGSVFCACLLHSFISNLAEFLTLTKPDLIILEATGLADPISLGQVLQAPEVQNQIYLAGIWTVVDCVNFHRSHKYLSQVKHQIQVASLILLNKTDQKEPDPALLTQLEEWNPFGKMVETIFGRIKNLTTLLEEQIFPDGLKPVLLGNPANRPNIGSCVVRTQKTFTQEQIQKFWSRHQNQFYRMKGYVRTPLGGSLVIHGVFNSLEFRTIDRSTGPTEVIFVGPGIQPGEISREFLNLT